jgi:hypothetical protein
MKRMGIQALYRRLRTTKRTSFIGTRGRRAARSKARRRRISASPTSNTTTDRQAAVVALPCPPEVDATLDIGGTNKDGFTSLLAVVAPNLLCKPATVLFNMVTIKGAKQALQMFGPAQHAVAKAVADSVAEGIIPRMRLTTFSSAWVCSFIGRLIRPFEYGFSSVRDGRRDRERPVG